MVTQIDSEFDTTALFDLRWEPEEAGRLIAYLLSEDSSFINGEVVRIDGGRLS